MKIDKNKLTIIIIGFLDVLSIGIFIPTLPDLITYYGVSAHMISYSIVAYGLFSFLSGPFLGQLSDRYGRKKILLLCVLGSFISSFFMSITSVFWAFLLGRIINGITGGNISIVQSMLSDISKTKEERLQNMGILGGLFGAGFIIGPIIGSLLLPFGVKAPFWFMTLFSLIEVFMLLLFLRETNENMVQKKIKVNPFGSIVKYLKNNEVKIFLISFFTLISSFSLYQGMLPVFLSKQYNLPGHTSGYVMSGIGLIIAINQAILLKKFWLKYFSLKKLFYISNIGIFIIFILLSIIKPLWLFLIVFFLLIFFQGIINPIYQGEIVENTHLHDRGEIMGVLSSLQSMSMFIGPLIGGFCIDKGISIFLLGSVIVFINILILSGLIKKIKN
ncbi:MFS transporter [Candidatus Gracilibacteria bacterium]|nr:MFS transporter [Candidatus Gracilibacteria bacterium]NUJ98999.1 MFS transporter [Candidatus Gracilibacteria bacterium]